jgi:hypothetical protein
MVFPPSLDISAGAPHSTNTNTEDKKRVQPQQVCLRSISSFCVPAQEYNPSVLGVWFNAKNRLNTKSRLRLLSLV